VNLVGFLVCVVFPFFPVCKMTSLDDLIVAVKSLQKQVGDLVTETSKVNHELGNVKKELGTVKSDLVAVSAELKVVKASGGSSGSGSGTGGGGSGGGSSSSHSFVIDSSFPIPIYNSSSMSPDHFLLEVEEFLTLKGINKTAWTALVSRMLPSDSDLIQWWRAVRTSVVSWDDFKRVLKLMSRVTQIHTS
jgi:hypothetical protein